MPLLLVYQNKKKNPLYHCSFSLLHIHKLVLFVFTLVQTANVSMTTDRKTKADTSERQRLQVMLVVPHTCLCWRAEQDHQAPESCPTEHQWAVV